MPRYELPRDISPEEGRAIAAALEEVFARTEAPPSPWALAGRSEALRLGALQARHAGGSGWGFRGHVPFARRGTLPFVGRGDAK